MGRVLPGDAQTHDDIEDYDDDNDGDDDGDSDGDDDGDDDNEDNDDDKDGDEDHCAVPFVAGSYRFLQKLACACTTITNTPIHELSCQVFQSHTQVYTELSTRVC